MDVESFVGLAVRSRLLADEPLRHLIRVSPEAASTDARGLADWLVAKDLITPFQADKLLRGAWRGLVIGPYEVRDLLGKGGMGTVFLAFDHDRKRWAALKVLPPNKQSNKRNFRRFRREYHVSRQLQHPGIALAYEAGLYENVPFLAMEYVPGPTLYRLVRQTTVAPAWGATWIAQVANALDYAHQSGVVHRDLKPSNVIITPAADAKLLDLGLARWYQDDHNEERVVGQRRIVGSFDYIAPEQALDSARADARSDIYSLGCLLYFSLTGQPPFAHATTVQEKLACHRVEEPRPLEQMRPDTPAALCGIVRRMMAKNPAQRFQVAAAARDALKKFHDAEPMPEPAIPIPDHETRRLASEYMLRPAATSSRGGIFGKLNRLFGAKE